MPIEIRKIAAAETRPLRQKILRPGRPPEECIYPADDDPHSFHLGAHDQGNLIGIASFYKEGSHPESWRLRGMAVLTELQGQGIGKKILSEGIAEIRRRNGRELWCNARTTACDFYFSFGFRREGEEFELPGIGPHYLLKLPI